MVKDRSVAVFWLTLCLAACAWAQVRPAGAPLGRPMGQLSPRTATALFSPSAAERFWEIGYELARSPRITGPQVDQAIILLTAARQLNSQAENIEPLLLELATRQTERDYSPQVLTWLQRYVSESADRAIISDAIAYLLGRQDSTAGRQELLAQLVRTIGNKNAAIDSELATLLGQQMIEKGDAKAARFYFLQAYKSNKYNPLAFAKLAELAPNEIGPANYLEHLRLIVREDPLDMDAVLNLAQYAERLQLYEVAAGSYRYAAELFRYLYPNQPVPPHIYLPWAITCYNTPGQQNVCLEIAEGVRSQGRFNILLEAVAGRAAARAGKAEQAQQIFAQAEQKAQQLLQGGPGRALVEKVGGTGGADELSPKQLAWFYCFATPNAVKALDWANKGYSAEPKSPAAGALLAYALSMNGQLEWAKPLLQSFAHNQIADLVQAQIELAQGEKASAIVTLTAAVAKDPGSLAAERAREILREQGSEYRPPVDGAALIAYLANDLRQAVVPQFVSPEQCIELQLDVRGSEFAYGAAIEGTVAVVNKGAEPLVVTENGLFTGRIRVDARITGDLKQEIPMLVSQTIRTSLTVPPGRSVAAVIPLSTGQLRQVLLDHPQASLGIELTLYVDPVTAEDGSVRNRLADLEPVKVSVRRLGLDLSGPYVRNRFNSIASGQEAQKLRTAQLFTGLLKEKQAMDRHGTLYAFRYADWLGELLRSSLLSESGLLLSEGQGQWVVKVNTMADMLSMTIDPELAAVVARDLNHPDWPVRLMAVHLLATGPEGDFDKVLDWVARQDSHELVRSLATVLRSARPNVSHGTPATSDGGFRLLR